MFLDFIFETSWEVCNKVGGIYTVLSTRAKTLQEIMRDRIVFIGPDCFNGEENPYFFEDKALFNDWLAVAKHDGLSLKIYSTFFNLFQFLIIQNSKLHHYK